jgi:KRAB domain-containing zinc finger protein
VKNIHTEKIEKFPFECQFCDEKFSKAASLKIHITTKHDGKKVPEFFECDFDGKIFNTKSDLYRHIRFHEKKVKCEFCHVECFPANVSRHFKDFHTNKPKFQCKICNKNFNASFLLKNHVKIHNKKFKCQICSRMFPSQGGLNMHSRRFHENPGSYKCAVCDRKFNKIESMNSHKKTHMKNCPKLFKCQRCDFDTNYKANIENHQNFHRNQDKKFAAMKNPQKCQKCPTYCKDKYALSTHMKNVHSEVRFQCDLCGKYFKRKYNTRIHIEICHKIK